MENFTSVLQWAETAVLQTYFNVISIRHQFTVRIRGGHKYLMKMKEKKSAGRPFGTFRDVSKSRPELGVLPNRQVPPLQSQTPNP